MAIETKTAEVSRVRAREIGLALLMFALAFAIYAPVWHGGFLWDDDGMIHENAVVKSADGLKTIWNGEKLPDYFPLTYTMFWLEWPRFGMNPTGYHLINIFLHGLNVLLLWRVLLRLRIPGALLAAFIFLAHPVCVTSVAWIAERKNVLSMCFYLLSLLMFLRFEADNRKRWFGISLFCFVLALLSKTSVVILPVVLLGCAWWQRNEITRRDLVRAIPFFVLSVLMGLITVWFQSHRALGGHTDSLVVRLLGGTWAVWFYLFKAVLPLKLMMVYPRWEIDPRSVPAYVPALLWCGLIFSAWRFRHRIGRGPLFALGYFFTALGPVLGVFDMSFLAYARASDHWQYLAIIGVCVLLASGMCLGFEKKFSGSPIMFRNGIAAVLIGALSALAWHRAQAFSSTEALWRDNLAKNPKAWVACNNLALVLTNKAEANRLYEQALQVKPDYPEAHNNLGYALAEERKFDEAFPHYFAALKARPKYADAHNNLGNAYAQTGKLDEAIAEYNIALQIRPAYALVHNNLGHALARKGKYEDAIAHYRIALQLNPNYSFARNNLGLALMAQKKMSEAIEEFRAAIRIDANYAEAHSNLANALSETGDNDGAIAEWNTALRLNPNRAETFNSLGIAAASKGDFAQATRYFSEALRVQPDHAGALSNMGNLSAQQGKFDEAIAHYTAALRIDGNDSGTHNNLGNVLVEKGRFDEAVQQYLAALKFEPSSPSLHLHCGVALARQGKRNEAAEHFHEALRLKPDWPEARKQLAMLQGRD